MYGKILTRGVTVTSATVMSCATSCRVTVVATRGKSGSFSSDGGGVGRGGGYLLQRQLG